VPLLSTNTLLYLIFILVGQKLYSVSLLLLLSLQPMEDFDFDLADDDILPSAVELRSVCVSVS